MSEKDSIFDHQEARRIAQMLRDKEAYISELEQQNARQKIVIEALCITVAETTRNEGNGNQ